MRVSLTLTPGLLGIVRPGDATLQALTILSTIHGFVTMVIDNRVSALLGEDYPISDVRDAVLAAIFEGLGPHNPDSTGL